MNLAIKEFIPTSVPIWCDLFNHPHFYNLHKTNSSFYLSFFLEEELVGLCHFTEVGSGVYRSPHKGTYGDISFKNELNLETKYKAIDLLLAFFKTIEAKEIEIIAQPFAHELNKSSCLLNIYLNKSFTISNQEINHTLEIDDQPLALKMMRNNKKRLNKCDREGFLFEQIFLKNEIETVYQIIKQNRENKGYQVSMSLQQILDMYALFPENLFFFKSSHNNNCIAASVCLKLNHSVLYVFYWGDKPGYEQYSSVVHLANGIYKFAQQNNFKIIDAGTSSIKGIPNYGVATFKENLGFTISPKLSYFKQL